VPMTTCPDCGEPLSTEATQCPSCGFTPAHRQKKSSSNAWLIGCGIAAAVGFVLVVIVGLLAAIAVPAFIKARGSAQRSGCINNLRQIDSAKDQYALEYGGDEGTVISAAQIDIYVRDVNSLVCPVIRDTGGTFADSYDIGAFTSPPRCKVAEDQGHVLNNSSYY
jgi:competence protein ComGC